MDLFTSAFILSASIFSSVHLYPFSSFLNQFFQVDPRIKGRTPSCKQDRALLFPTLTEFI